MGMVIVMVMTMMMGVMAHSPSPGAALNPR
jgi:hypothetical protein